MLKQRITTKFFATALTALFLVAAFFGAPLAAQDIEFVEALFDETDGIDGLAAPRFAAMSPNGAHLYVAAELDSAISLFERNRKTGELTYVESVFDGIDGVDGLNGATVIAISPNGRHVYVGGAFESAVAIFERNNATGRLTYVDAIFNGAGGVDGIMAPVWVTVSPEGKNVYVSGFFQDSIAIFDRDNTTGLLTFLGTVTDGVDGVQGMDRPFGHQVSPDGTNLYVAGLGGTLVTFDRDRKTGELTFAGVLTDGVDGVDGILGARDVAVTNNGQFVYVAGLFNASVAVFERATSTGALSYVGFIGGLPNAASVVLDRGSQTLYVPVFFLNAVVSFDLENGIPVFTDFVQEGNNGVEGIARPLHVVPSPDGRHLYIPGSTSNGIGVFTVTQVSQ